MRILLVDDDRIHRQALAAVLRNADCEVVAQAGDGREALRYLRTLRVDLMITDCQMPGMNGIALTRTVRRQDPTLPIIMLSGQADPRVISLAMQAGISLYLDKPCTPESVLAAVHSVCAMHDA
jgi:DNA-binding NarL/FixJ family response regulator